MQNRTCDRCERVVAEDDICICLKNKIQHKRSLLEDDNLPDVPVSVFVVLDKDVLAFHVPSDKIPEFNNPESIKALQSIFPKITLMVLDKEVDISVIKEGE